MLRCLLGWTSETYRPQWMSEKAASSSNTHLYYIIGFTFWEALFENHGACEFELFGIKKLFQI